MVLLLTAGAGVASAGGRGVTVRTAGIIGADTKQTELAAAAVIDGFIAQSTRDTNVLRISLCYVSFNTKCAGCKNILPFLD